MIQKIGGFLNVGVGIAVLVGWELGSAFLTTAGNEAAVTMKPITAACFIATGFIIWVLNDISKPLNLLIFAFSCTTIVMGILEALITWLFQESGFVYFGLRDSAGALSTVSPGVPSIGTCICFLFVVLSTCINLKDVDSRVWYRATGYLLILLGSLSLFGYATGLGFLYWDLIGYSTAMAIHTSFLFVTSGISFLYVGIKKSTKKFADTVFLP